MENGTNKSRDFLYHINLYLNGTLLSADEVNSHKAERWVIGYVDTGSETTANVTSHNHEYQWVLVKAATVEEDGEEEYRCTVCEDVKARNTLSASMFYVKEFNRLIIEAAQDATITYDAGRNHCISDYVLKQLAARPDVSAVVTFEHEKVKYQITIPAGIDWTSLLEDNEQIYGYKSLPRFEGVEIITLPSQQ